MPNRRTSSSSRTSIRSCRSRRTRNGWCRRRPTRRGKYASLGVREPAGLADRRAGDVPSANRDWRLRLRSHLPWLRGHQPVRAVGGLAPRDGGGPPPHPGHRDRRAAGVSALRPVVVARRQLSASHVQRRAARELRPVSRSPLRSRVRRPSALHRLPLPRLRFRAERDRSGLHHAPDASQRRHRTDAGGPHRRPRHRAVAAAGPRLGLPRMAVLAALVDRDGRLEQRHQHDPGQGFRGGQSILGGRPPMVSQLDRLDAGEQGLPAAHSAHPRAARPSATSTARRRSSRIAASSSSSTRTGAACRPSSRSTTPSA